MIDELNQAISDYQAKWQSLVDGRSNKVFFEKQKPTGVGWKVNDTVELVQKFEALRDRCDQIHFGWIDGRWLVTMHKKDGPLVWGIEIIKLLQRRPNATTATGFDHIDFYHPQNKTLEPILQTEPDLEWTHKTGNAHCTYYSLWFAGTEAKLRDNTVLDPCIAELQKVRHEVLQG